MRPYYEQIVRFGIRQNLNGIFAEPRDDRHADKPAIVILNSGVVHRVGHHRMYVTMARLLAAAGYPVLRFDFSGIGDSAGRSDSLEPDAAARVDIRSALDWLSETRGIKTAVLLGLCSGADSALKYGHTDDRINALVLLDPTIPPTFKFYLHYLSQRATNLRSWLTFLAGRGRIWGDLIRMVMATGVPLIDAQRRLGNTQSRKDLEALFRHSIDRRLTLLVVFTKGMAEYREQLLDAFPSLSFGKMLSLEYLNDCDHVFTSAKHREKLNQLVLALLQDMRLDDRTKASAAVK